MVSRCCNYCAQQTVNPSCRKLWDIEWNIVTANQKYQHSYKHNLKIMYSVKVQYATKNANM